MRRPLNGRRLVVALLIQAVQHVRRMRGGAQSHLMRCADGHYYVVKFQNNPQHTRVLVNDWLGTRLGEMIGLPVPVPAIVDVHPWLVEHTPDLRMELCGRRTMFTAGLSFGSRYVISPTEGQVYDYLPETMIPRVRNLRDFAGILALDKWTCNANGRQAAFWKKSRERKLTATFIDQGYCFNAGDWSFPDAPLRGVFGRNDVYLCITSWDSFEPWLTRIEEFPEGSLWPLAEQVPPEWYGGATDDLTRLLERLLERRSRVREQILAFKNSSRNPFPNWKERVN
ncbi:MAG TPA: HipA family kinase [Verrucomicrobiae bacterium]|nr:HipA family kinase [Verrucomicrobiae bacterium]